MIKNVLPAHRRLQPPLGSLQHKAIDDRLVVMRALTRLLLVLVCAVVLVGGSTESFAASVMIPCTHTNDDQQGTSPEPHQHRGAGCLTCCLGVCVAIPDLPPRTPLGATRFVATSVAYWEIELSLSGRSIRPDPAPPRTGA
jgi:hypothetical protein